MPPHRYQDKVKDPLFLGDELPLSPGPGYLSPLTPLPEAGRGGKTRGRVNPDVARELPTIRRLFFEGKTAEASRLTHRAGTWWMDLVSLGAFDDPSLWAMLRERMDLYEELYRHPKPYRPEAAAIVDKRAKFCVKSDWDSNYWTMYVLRDEAVKTGATVGFYSLDDFLTGVVPRCRAYVFANAFRMTDCQIRTARSRLDREEVTAVWIYAPAYLDPGGGDIDRASRLTGLRLAVRDGRQGGEGAGLLVGETWGEGFPLSSRLFVADEKAEPLGHYKSDGLISAAQASAGRRRSVFPRDMRVTSRMLGKLFRSAGAHLWTETDAVVRTDGDFLVIHTGAAGAMPILLLPGIDAEPIRGRIERREGRKLYVRCQPGDTLWFRLIPQEPGASGQPARR
ncbi:MAG: hypothetical protein IT210_06910 [Armatimonadetes bacterium]|nr:hypothetical protein [Armatimonadota bacterium]